MPQLLQAEQRTEEWFKARLGLATASRFSDIMAKTRSGYAASRANYMSELAIERLTGVPAESYQNGAMQWGTDNEPVAKLNYELATENPVEETGFWKHDTLMAGASPDGFVGDDGLVEIKCPNSATHIQTLKSKTIPRQYIAQVQGQMWITERKWCDFVSYDPRLPVNAQMTIIRIQRDDEYIAELEDEITKFLKEVDEQVDFVSNFNN